MQINKQATKIKIIGRYIICIMWYKPVVKLESQGEISENWINMKIEEMKPRKLQFKSF